MNAGGGVAFWIREDVGFTRLKSPFVEKELETIAIRIPSRNLVIINVYRGFGDVKKAVGLLTDFIDGLIGANKNSDIMVVGDMNVDLAYLTAKSEMVIQEMATRDLYQLVTKPTRVTSTSSTLIDHVYLKSPKTVSTLTIISDISDHYIVATVFPRKTKPVKSKTKITKRWFNDTSYEQLRLLLKSETWEDLLPLSLNAATNHLIERTKLYRVRNM